MKKLPIGVQTFSKLRDPEHNYIYIDKTDVLLRLVQSGEYFFLSRPRRFGKSVTLSTLYELFRGNRELFTGLYIEDKWDWNNKHPVIRISFGSGLYDTEKNFNRQLMRIMTDNLERLDLDCDLKSTDSVTCFHDLIKKSYQINKKKVVILIDEYDKPILDHITDKKTARANRDKLKGFYSISKDMDEYIRFVLITGVSKFSRMTLFSGLNNLRDITINTEYATLCGYTHAELENNFQDYLPGVNREKLQQWYNGYNYFGEPVYNPFDILLFFAEEKEYRPYWWSTGNPSFLIDLLKQQPRYLPDLENYIANDFVLDSFDVDHIDIVALLWQTGYLTFAEKLEKFGAVAYRLKVPNLEIQMSLNALFLDYLTTRKSETLEFRSQIFNALKKSDLKLFHQSLQGLFAAIPYQNYANKIIQNYEGYYASVVYAYLASLGLRLIAEDTSNKGRVDITIIIDDKVYVIEFKVNQPGKALEQILQKGYHQKYQTNQQEIYIIDINFDSNEKNITDFEWKRMQEQEN